MTRSGRRRMEAVGVDGTSGQRHKSKAVKEVEEEKEGKRGERKRREEKRFQTFEMGKPGVHIVMHHLRSTRGTHWEGGNDTQQI
jgi:hypothetical protein